MPSQIPIRHNLPTWYMAATTSWLPISAGLNPFTPCGLTTLVWQWSSITCTWSSHCSIDFKMVQYSTNSKCQVHHENQRSSSTPASAPSSNSWSHGNIHMATTRISLTLLESKPATPVTVGTLAISWLTQGCRSSSSKEENMPTKAERNLNSTWDETNCQLLAMRVFTHGSVTLSIVMRMIWIHDAIFATLGRHHTSGPIIKILIIYRNCMKRHHLVDIQRFTNCWTSMVKPVPTTPQIHFIQVTSMLMKGGYLSFSSSSFITATQMGGGFVKASALDKNMYSHPNSFAKGSAPGLNKNLTWWQFWRKEV